MRATHTHARARTRTHAHTHTHLGFSDIWALKICATLLAGSPSFVFPEKKQNKENHSRSQQNIPQPTRSKKMERKPVIFVQGANDKIKFILFLKSHSVRTTKKIEGEGKTR